MLLNSNSSALEAVPKEINTKQFFLDAIYRAAGALRYAPSHLRSEEFYIEALKASDGASSLYDVPAEFRTEKVCLANLKDQRYPEYDFKDYVPKELQSIVRQKLGL